MTWDEMVAEFRALGGVVDNVHVGRGAHGRGLFPIEPSQPVRLLIPPTLMIPTRDTELRAGELVVRSGAARKKETRFFDEYQRSIGWSAGSRDEALDTQRGWHELPEEIVSAIKAAGLLEVAESRFDAPSEKNALQQYILSRSFFHEGNMRFIPMVELVNHRPDAGTFSTVNDLTGVEGYFDSEVALCYNAFDALGIATSFSFATNSTFAHSVGASLGLHGGLQLTITRAVYQSKGGTPNPYPIVRSIGKNHVQLSFLTLANVAAPDSPREIFREVTAPYIGQAQADEAFGGIVQFNQEAIGELVGILRRHDLPLVRILEQAALHQLNALTA